MATPITHIVLSKQIFLEFFPDLNWGEFIIGTSFPDIRYLGVIDRMTSHGNNQFRNIGNITGPDAFSTGAAFHSFTDLVREQFVINTDFYSQYPNKKISALALKFVEDRFCFSMIDDWKEITNSFDRNLSGERKWGIEEEKLHEWHRLLQKYFSLGPTLENIRYFLEYVRLPLGLIEEILLLIKQMENDDNVIKITSQLFSQFHILVEKGVDSQFSLN